MKTTVANGAAYRGTPRREAMSSGRLWQIGLGVVGLLISVYLTATHYFAEQVPLACSTGGIVDCEQVTNSAEALVGPVPVAVLGVVWFVAFIALAGSRAVNGKMVWAVLGLLSIFYLVYAELFLIGALCLWCTAIHAIVVILFLLTLWEATGPSPELREDVRDRLRPLG